MCCSLGCLLPVRKCLTLSLYVIHVLYLPVCVCTCRGQRWVLGVFLDSCTPDLYMRFDD